MQVCPNEVKLLDSFDYTSIKKFSELYKADQIIHFYKNEGLSSREISEKIGISKTKILGLLKELGVSTSGRPTNGKAPFGFTYHAGKLIPVKKESLVCQKITDYREQGKSYREIAALFQTKQVQRRSGSTKWDHDSIRKIYKKWTQFLQGDQV